MEGGGWRVEGEGWKVKEETEGRGATWRAGPSKDLGAASIDELAPAPEESSPSSVIALRWLTFWSARRRDAGAVPDS